MATRANINLDFEVILKNYRTNQQDGPVRAHFVKWQADVKAAIAREKQIKGWIRVKKIALIKSLNPTWRDLSEDF